MKPPSNPHTARQDAEAWKHLYEVQLRENAIKQVIIETIARELMSVKEISPELRGAESLERSAESVEPRAQSPEQTPWSDEDAEGMGFEIRRGKELVIYDTRARWLSREETVALSRWLAAKVEQSQWTKR